MNPNTPMIRVIAAACTLPLRQSELRPGHPLPEAVFAGDGDAETLHMGAFVGERLVGVASFYLRSLPTPAEGPSEAAASTCWQLRGMAVGAAHQGTGAGNALLGAGIERLRQAGGSLLWCNARVRALGFYLKAGFEICSAEFAIPEAGPHFVMARRL